MWLGMPIGPTTANRLVPTWQFCCISRVVLPTAWITSVIVPCSGSKSASVSGMRSPVLVLHHDDELAGLGGLRHRRMADLQHVGDVGVVLAVDDLEIGHSCFLASWPARGMPAPRTSSIRARPPLATDATPRTPGRKGCSDINLDLHQPVRCGRNADARAPGARRSPASRPLLRPQDSDERSRPPPRSASPSSATAAAAGARSHPRCCSRSSARPAPPRCRRRCWWASRRPTTRPCTS